MSRAALALDVDSASASKTKAGPGSLRSNLRVNPPGDSFEMEADRVADTVSRGERIPGWSLAKSGFDGIQRQSAPPTAGPSPQALPIGDILPKLAEAFMATPAGKDILQKIKDNPAVHGAAGLATSPVGMVITGSAAIGTVSALAAAHKPLPLQIPKIPLDFVHPGLSVKINYQGPVNQPVAASLTLSFEGKSAKKKPQQTQAEKYREDTARVAADQEKFRAGLHPAPAAKSANKDEPRLAHAPAPGTARPAPTLVDKKLELKPLTSLAPKPEADGKKEEIPVQRKAERLDAASADPSEVTGVLGSSGRPLDRETRRYMEARIGFDFRKVRVHTGAGAASSARAMQAQAYTVGSDVVFASGRYAPHTAAGRRLLAHELTHVVQQDRSQARAHPVVRPAPRQIQRQEDEQGPSLLKNPKGWALAKLRKIPGYDLFCTLIGKDLATGAEKDHSPGALLREVLKLVHGEEAYDRVVASGAVQKAYEWVTRELDTLGLNLGSIKGLIAKAIDSVGPGDFFNITGAVERIVGIFRPTFDKVLAFAGAAVNKLFEIAVQVVMERFGDLGQRVMGIISKVSGTFRMIVKDPVKFVGYLVQAIKLGFSTFAEKILSHLQVSLMDFLFGELGSKIKPPKEFSIPAVFNLVLDVLDLHYDKFRERLVKKTSPETVAFLEGTVDFIMKLASAKSLAGAWDIFKKRAGELIDGLVNSAIDAIKNWVFTKLVQAALVKIVQLFNPASAIVAAIEAIYHTIVFLIEKAKQLAAVLEAVTNSISLIAEGNIGQAADWVDRSMSKALTVILAFFAEQAGLGGIGETIRGLIAKVRDKVWEAIDKVIDYVIAGAKNLYAKGKATAAKVVEWWKQKLPFNFGDEKHELYLEGDGDHPQVMVHSKDSPLEQFLNDVHAEDKQKEPILTLAKKLKWRKGALEKPDQADSEASENFKKLSALMGQLSSVKRAPKAKPPKYSPVHAFGGGQKVDAFLSADHEVGSRPVHGDDPNIWEKLGSIQKQKSYVRGHLLSMRLGGVGEWRNMMPITNTANQRMEEAVEGKLNRAISTGKRYFHYVVQAEYADAPQNPRTEESAEQRLKNLSWSVQPAAYEGGEWKEKKGPLLDDSGKDLGITQWSVKPTVKAG